MTVNWYAQKIAHLLSVNGRFPYWYPVKSRGAYGWLGMATLKKGEMGSPTRPLPVKYGFGPKSAGPGGKAAKLDISVVM